MGLAFSFWVSFGWLEGEHQEAAWLLLSLHDMAQCSHLFLWLTWKLKQQLLFFFLRIPDCWDPFFVRRILQSRDVLHKTRFSSNVCSGLIVSQQDIAWLRILAPETWRAYQGWSRHLGNACSRHNMCERCMVWFHMLDVEIHGLYTTYTSRNIFVVILDTK